MAIYLGGENGVMAIFGSFALRGINRYLVGGSGRTIATI